VARPIPLEAPEITITCSRTGFFTSPASPGIGGHKPGGTVLLMPFGIGVTELVILLVALLVIFGPKRLPEMGRSLGKGMREFKDSISGKDDDDEAVHHRLAQELPPAEEHPVAQQQQAREREVS
jgi:sec-independent protein translocase protein TatA